MIEAEPQLQEDPFAARLVRSADGLLATFNAVGVLSPADVHVATRLAQLVQEKDEAVRLAVALAVRAPRLGHVFVDLASIHATANLESEEAIDVGDLPWPEPGGWTEAVRTSVLVAAGEDAPDVDRPLRLIGTRLYLDRYWHEERDVAGDLLALAGAADPPVDEAALNEGLERLFPADGDGRQRLAAAAAVFRPFAVVAGGPGTGKTTTVARIVALLAEQAAATGARPPLVALCAPTGKAAARLQEAVHDEAERLTVTDPIRRQLLGLKASTIHRLLGWRRASHSRFAHDRHNRLPHDVVVVDETSMVSLSIMARLVEAVRADARLILVGDPGQLRSIEAGVVLADIVGPAATADDITVKATAPIGGGIVVLDRVHRYGRGIATLAEAIRHGDGDRTLLALAEAPGEITWLPFDVEDAGADEAMEAVRAEAVGAGGSMFEAAAAGAVQEALDALGAFRLLCAHRRGPHGVSAWTSRVESWLRAAVDGLELGERDYVGRPLLITRNDYELGLYNGDAGVIVADPDREMSAVFDTGGQLVGVSPLRLDAVETVYAMTIHKSQGSQFLTAAVILPAVDSRILTRELLYTAVTRARNRLILVGDEAAIRAAVSRPVARASGLRERLWGDL